jgi:hypothetical protein
MLCRPGTQNSCTGLYTGKGLPCHGTGARNSIRFPVSYPPKNGGHHHQRRVAWASISDSRPAKDTGALYIPQAARRPIRDRGVSEYRLIGFHTRMGSRDSTHRKCDCARDDRGLCHSQALCKGCTLALWLGHAGALPHVLRIVCLNADLSMTFPATSS